MRFGMSKISILEEEVVFFLIFFIDFNNENKHQELLRFIIYFSIFC